MSVVVVVDVNQVNSSAAVPTTSTSMTMPLRKNLGFNEEASGWNRRRRASPWVEYSVGLHFVWMTRSGHSRNEVPCASAIRRVACNGCDDADRFLRDW